MWRMTVPLLLPSGIYAIKRERVLFTNRDIIAPKPGEFRIKKQIIQLLVGILVTGVNYEYFLICGLTLPYEATQGGASSSQPCSSPVLAVN